MRYQRPQGEQKIAKVAKVSTTSTTSAPETNVYGQIYYWGNVEPLSGSSPADWGYPNLKPLAYSTTATPTAADWHALDMPLTFVNGDTLAGSGMPTGVHFVKLCNLSDSLDDRAYNNDQTNFGAVGSVAGDPTIAKAIAYGSTLKMWFSETILISAGTFAPSAITSHLQCYSDNLSAGSSLALAISGSTVLVSQADNTLTVQMNRPLNDYETATLSILDLGLGTDLDGNPIQETSNYPIARPGDRYCYVLCINNIEPTNLYYGDIVRILPSKFINVTDSKGVTKKLYSVVAMKAQANMGWGAAFNPWAPSSFGGYAAGGYNGLAAGIIT